MGRARGGAAVIRMLAILALLAGGVGSGAGGAPDAPRFRVLDVILDAAADVAAWQVEIVARSGDARVVGVEGAGAPFAAPPYYDPAALQQGRVVLAAFNTRAALVAG